jgi:hypothetical protein
MNLLNLKALKNVVWTSVFSVGAVVGILVSAILGNELWVLASGFIGIISAVLSAREQR